MARYETYHSTVAQSPLMRRWIFRALILSLGLHGGLFVFFNMKRLDNFVMGEAETLAPPKFVVNKVTVDPKTLEDPEEIRSTISEQPKATKIEVPAEKIEATEIVVKPSAAEISSPLLNDKPPKQAISSDLIAKAEATSTGTMEKELGSLANSLIKESVRNANQPVIFTMPKGSQEIGGGAGDRDGVPGLPSLDDAIAATGPLASGARLGVRGGALFEYDKADLLQQAIEDLQKLGEIIKRNPRATFVIEGHTDSFGGTNYNIQLSQRRADAVKEWLVTNMGIEPERVTTIGLGNAKPIVPATATVDEQAPNRRVEIVIKTNRAK